MNSLSDAENELPARLAALPGVRVLREAAGDLPLFLVGGAVRDLLMGAERADLDVAVEGSLARLLTGLGEPTTEHERFGTAHLRLEGVEVDLAISRRESYAAPGALPEVEAAPIAEDLARRDFTINAMAVPLGDDPKLIDPHGGRADLEQGLLRVLHPGSFADDPTRALRAARYAARFGFRLADETAALLSGADLGTVSADRMEAELRRLAAERSAARGFALLDRWGVQKLPAGAPELVETVVDLLAAPPWAGTAERPAAVLAATREPGAAVRNLAAARPERPSQAVVLARPNDPVELILARALGAEWLDTYQAEWRHVRLDIDGEDLMAAGIAEGPAIGAGLAAALTAKLDGQIDGGAEQELERALAAARD